MRELYDVIQAIKDGGDITNAEARALLDSRKQFIDLWFRVSEDWARVVVRQQRSMAVDFDAELSRLRAMIDRIEGGARQ